MGQAATLYRISKTDLDAIAENLENWARDKMTKEDQLFDSTFDGLCFLLSKNQDAETATLVQQIFFPQKSIGEEVDFSSLDWENIPDDFNFESRAIYYHDPEKIAAINSVLDKISTEKFKELFDADELNKNGVYPAGAWNYETGPDNGFNELLMTEKFINLKAIFSNAKNEEDYILSFVG